MTKDTLNTYKAIIDACNTIELKGKNMLYTSDNGHMFSQLNKAGEIGFRFSETRKKELIEQLKTTEFKSYGATMKGYVLMPKKVLENTEVAASYLQESQKYVMSLEPK